MSFQNSYHVSFRLAAEFREKVRRGKDDFGRTGLFLSCETLRGVYDFEVTNPDYFERLDFQPYSVIIVEGQVKHRSGNTVLEPREFLLCEGNDLMIEAERMVEFGLVQGQTFVSRKGYTRREDDVLIPRVECKGMGFCDSFDDSELFNSLPADKSVLMRYFANVALDNRFVSRGGETSRRNTWVLSNQRVEPIQPRQARRPEHKEEK